MQPKPLTKDERSEISQKLAIVDYLHDTSVHPVAIQFIRKLLAAEQFWREAVKNNEPAEYYGVYDRKRCYFCQHDLNELERSQQPSDWNAVNHEETCPWLLAQESVE